MTICIGHMGGRGWRAELDFEEQVARIGQPHPTQPGFTLDIATVPLGECTEETDDRSPELIDDEQNRRLMMLTFAPDAWELLRVIRDELASRRPLEDHTTNSVGEKAHPYDYERQDANLLDCINGTLDFLNVPKEGE